MWIGSLKIQSMPTPSIYESCGHVLDSNIVILMNPFANKKKLVTNK